MKKLEFKLTLLAIWGCCIYLAIFKFNINGVLMVALSYLVGLLIKQIANLCYPKKDA